MNAPDKHAAFSQLDLDALMEQIRTEVNERKERSGAVAHASQGVSATGTDLSSRHWTAAGLLALPVADFARATHLAFFGRDPTPEEFVGLRDRLLHGVGRMRVLREFQSSAEAQRRQVKIDGLWSAFVRDRIYWSPVAKFGRWLLAALRYIVLTPRRIRQFIARVDTLEKRSAEAGSSLRELKAGQIADRQNTGTQIRRLREEAEGRYRALAARADASDRTIAERTRDIDARAAALLAETEQKFADHWRNIVEQKLRWESLSSGQAPVRPVQNDEARPDDSRAEPGSPLLDALYISFEDRYRGTRDDIKDRQRIYLPSIETCVKATQGIVVDIGCGRGEWLEVLSEAGVDARGYDLNRIAISECLERGLDARFEEGAVAVAALPEGSVSAITAFHVIEHIPFDALVSFVDHSFRVLRSGGLLILETPNPANLLVAAERFYLDPTHRNPLPSELVSYLVQSRGFAEVEVLPLHPVDWAGRRSYDDPMLSLLQERLFGPQDYAVIARKRA